MTASKQSGLSERLAQRLNAKKNPGNPEPTPWPEVMGQGDLSGEAPTGVLASLVVPTQAPSQPSEAPNRPAEAPSQPTQTSRGPCETLSPAPIPTPAQAEPTPVPPTEPSATGTPELESIPSSAHPRGSEGTPARLAPSWVDRHIRSLAILLGLLLFPSLWCLATDMGALTLLAVGFTLGLTAGLTLAGRYHRTRRSRSET